MSSARGSGSGSVSAAMSGGLQHRLPFSLQRSTSCLSSLLPKNPAHCAPCRSCKTWCRPDEGWATVTYDVPWQHCVIRVARGCILVCGDVCQVRAPVAVEAGDTPRIQDSGGARERAAACHDRHASESGGLAKGHLILAGPNFLKGRCLGGSRYTHTHATWGNKMASSSSLVTKMRRAAAEEDSWHQGAVTSARPYNCACREVSAAPKRFCSGRTRTAISFVLDTWGSSFLSFFARFIRRASAGLGLLELVVSGSFGSNA